MTRKLDPFTLRHVTRWHRAEAKLLHEDFYVATSQGRHKAADRLHVRAGEQAKAAFHWEAQAKKSVSLTKSRKLTPATTLCGPIPSKPLSGARKRKG